MKFFERMKSDKAYRFRVIILIVIALLIYPNLGTDKKEAPVRQTFETCHQYNSFICTIFSSGGEGWIFEGEKYYNNLCGEEGISLCKNAGCYVAVLPQFGTNPKVCVPYITNGWVSIPSQDAVNACINGCTGDTFGTEGIFCQPCDPGEEPQYCNSGEQSVANMIKSLGISMPCKTAYTLTIIGGGFLALLLLAMM